jgi:hypothetical protein
MYVSLDILLTLLLTCRSAINSRELSIDDFPARSIPRGCLRTVRVAVDPNDDRDLDVEDDFFKNGFSRECSAI